MARRAWYVLSLVLLSAGGAAAQTPTYVVDVSQAPVSVRMTIASLQGLVNRRFDQGPLYLLKDPNDARWLRLYTQQPTYVKIDDLIAALGGKESYPATTLARQARGQVLYEPTKPYTLAIATTLAGVLDGVVTDRDLGMRTLLDCRQRWANKLDAYRWALKEALPKCAKDRMAISGITMECLRDILVRDRIFVTDLDPRESSEYDLLLELLPNFSVGAEALCHPSVAVDSAWRELLTSSSMIPVPCSDMANLSFHASAKPAQVPPQKMPFTERGDGVLLTFVYSGGEDMAYALGFMRDLWESPGRGSVPAGWTIPAPLLKYAPAVFQYYSVRSLRSPSDELVWAPNIYGSIQPSGIHGRQELWDKIASSTRPAGVLTGEVSDSGDESLATAAVARLIPAAAIRGVFFTSDTKATPGLYGSVLAVSQSYRATEPFTALKDLRALYDAKKPVYVSVDPRSITPADLSWLAGRLSDRFQVVGPAEFCNLAAADMKQQPSVSRRRGSFTVEDVALSSVLAGPGDSINLSAKVTSRWDIDAVSAVYSCPVTAQAAEQPMASGSDGAYTCTLPPCPFGGPGSVQVHVRDVDGHTFLSEPALFRIDAPDSDMDRLSDAAEAILRTDPHNRDSDGDGLRDGNDPSPLEPGRAESLYLPHFSPSGDAPFLSEDKGSKLVEDRIREVEGEATWTYSLPLGSVPPGASAVVNLLLSGDIAVSASSGDGEWREAVTCSSVQPETHSWPIPGDWLDKPAVLLRFAASAAGKSGRFHSASITPPPDSPSIILISPTPSHPAADENVLVGATVYDPAGLARVWAAYTTQRGGEASLTLWEVGSTQNFGVALPGARDGDIITCWIAAENAKGVRSTSSKLALPVGVTSREIISLVGGRDFEGPWRPGPEWGGQSRWVAASDQTERATFLGDGGNYSVWLLAAPRGRALRVVLDKLSVELSATAPDGWQNMGSVYLSKGEHTIQITSGEAPLSPLAACGYAGVLLTPDRKFEPPDAMLDYLNALTLITPKPGDRVWGQVEVKAEATGNITRIECLLDSKIIGATNRSPLDFKFDTRDITEGRHLLVLRGYSHAREQLLDLVAPIVVGQP